MTENIAAALAYAKRGVPVLPLHWPKDGACSCGEADCDSPGKHPLADAVPHGKDDATTDPEIIKSWWGRWPKANIGLRMGNGRVALDVDPRHGGDESLRDLGPLPDTVTALTGGGGQHLIFKADGPIAHRKGARPGLDIITNGYLVAPRSRHFSGRRYEWEVDHAPGQIALAPLPPALAELAQDGRKPAEPLPERIVAGQRDDLLTSLAGSMRRRGASPEAIEAALLTENETRCDPPLPERDVQRIARSIGRYKPAPQGDDGLRVVPDSNLTIGDVEAVFQKWLLLADTLVIRTGLAATIAHRMGLDPVWLLIIKPPGSGKTEIVNSLSLVTGAYPLSSLTPQTLASGRKVKGESAEFSLLQRLPGGATLLLKDFTTILSLHREARAEILSQLREVADGSFHKEFGNGVVVDWRGQLGFVAGCTEAIDTHHAVIQVLGERYIQVRPPAEDQLLIARRAIQNRGKEAAMREDLAQTVAAFANGLTLPRGEDMQVPEAIIDAIANLAALIVRARSAVIRDPYRREIDYIPQPESTGRLAKQLASLGLALAVLERRPDMTAADYSNVFQVGLDSIPRDRRTVLEALLRLDEEATTTRLATSIGYPSNATHRILENLTAMGLAERIPYGPGRADCWLPTREAEEFYHAAQAPLLLTSSEKSSGEGIEREILNVRYSDISDEVSSAQEASGQ
jgi:hypothetical protein